MHIKNNILIVDDDLNYCNILSETLRHRGLNTIVKNDGLEAIKFFKDHTVDLIIMDYCMPNMDGLSVLKILKNNPKTMNIPVIMISSNNINSFGCSFLRKPFKIQDMITLLSRFLQEADVHHSVFLP